MQDVIDAIRHTNTESSRTQAQDIDGAAAAWQAAAVAWQTAAAAWQAAAAAWQAAAAASQAAAAASQAAAVAWLAVLEKSFSYSKKHYAVIFLEGGVGPNH